MRFQPAALLIATILPFVATAGTSGTFEVGRRGHVLVPVSVDGREATLFALDTAASQTVLDEKLFAKQGEEQAPADDSPGHARGAHGTHAARGTRVASIVLWQVEQRDQFAALMRLEDLTRGKEPDFSGVLGLPFLSRYRLDLDYPNRRITLDENDGQLAPCNICEPERAVTITPLMGGLPSVPVTVNGRAMTALLDTGAGSTIINAAAASALGLGEPGSPDATTRLAVALGNLPAREHDVKRIELPVFRTLGLDSQPAMILGIDYLGSGRTVLDLDARRVWFQAKLD